MRTGTITERKPFVLAVVVALCLVVGSIAVAGTVAADDGDGTESFGVTAGATAQPPVDADGTERIQLSETSSEDFSTAGTSTFTLPADADVRFDVEATDPQANASGSEDIDVRDVRVVDDRTVEVDITNASAAETESLSIVGLRFEVPADAAATTGTWRFGTASAEIEFVPERLTPEVSADPIPRGMDGAPEEAGVRIDALDARSGGFHAEGERMAIYIPEGQRDRLSFDTRSDPKIELFGGECASETDSVTRLVPAPEDRGLTEDVFFFELDCELGNEESVLVTDLRFNTTGVGMDEPAEFDSTLVVESVPVNATGPVGVDTDAALSVVAPEVSASADTIAVPANGTGVTGDAPAGVSVADDIGGLLMEGSEVVVTLDGAGVTFDDSQTVTVDNDGIEATVTGVTAREITLAIESESEAGDSLALSGADGDGLAFDVAADAESARLAVTTSAGGEAVTQDAGSKIVVEAADDAGSGGDNDDTDDDVVETPSSGGGPTDESDGDDFLDTSDTEAETLDGEGDSLPSDAERRRIADAMPDREGVTVTFESVAVESITFVDGAAGEVTVTPMETLPDGVSRPAGGMVMAMDIEVPSGLSERPATMRVTVEKSTLAGAATDGVVLSHYDAETGEWEKLETDAVAAGETTVTFEATTPGFSPFVLQTSDADSTAETTATATPNGTATPTADDTGDRAEVASIGGDPVLPLTMGLVALFALGGVFLARRL